MWPWMQPNTAEPSSAPKIWPSPRNVEMGHVTLTMTHSGMTCQQAGMKFLTTPITKIWKAVQNVEIGVVWGGYGSFKVIGNVTIRWSACDFLFDFNRNCVSILYRFRDSQSKSGKSPILTDPTCIWRPRRGWPRSNSRSSLATET